MRLASTTSCTACAACVDCCQHDALSLSLDDNGFYYIEKDTINCVNCGLCSRICTVLNPSLIDKDNLNLSKPYAAWCEDNDLRNKSASGGAFAAIAKTFLEKGAIVYGAAIDGFEIHHIRIERYEDLPLILGSKYQHSRMDGVYRQVCKDLRDGRIVLYSGLSCQVAGVLSFVPKKLQAHLYTLDTICGGVSTMLPMLQLKISKQYAGIHSFRNKDHGWISTGYKYNLKMRKEDGSVCNLGSDNLVIQCFCHKETKRSSCLDCQFNGFHRISDVTIGDFWGDKQFPEQHNRGLSVLIEHTGRIFKYLNTHTLKLKPVSWKDAIEFNPNYYWSYGSVLRKSLIRKRTLSSLRKGNNNLTKKNLNNSSILRKIEYYLFYIGNEKRRLKYLSSILKNINNEN